MHQTYFLSRLFLKPSPIIVKEALACNCPIVSTDVGHVAELIKDVPNTYITSYEPDDIRKKLT